MRRLSGTLDGVEYVITEYDRGMVECPSVLVERLRPDPRAAFPAGVALTFACQQLFGGSLTIRELAPPGEAR